MYIDPFKEAKKYGIEVKPISKLKNITPDLCGYIEKDKNNKVTIYYNSNHPINRIRFTIAHELAHFLLGHLNEEKKFFRDTTENFNTNSHLPKEIEANKMAAKILMPEDKIKYLIFEKNITSIKELAKIMKVSEVAMKYRLQNLGLING
ncbi:MAG: ImmA/IrrE family metallo-endopeptidase [Epsilonproteobacteria bacterium]|nr:ImmA/IrrE family metallo-endopeptidase [Campylobacterota bacterium]